MAHSQLKSNHRYDHVYAIVRFDTTAGDDAPIDLRITVKKIVFDAAQAESEVHRLNELNGGKGCYYFSQVTRMESLPVVAYEVGNHADEVSSARAE